MPTAAMPRGRNLQIFTLQQSVDYKTPASSNYNPTLLYNYGVRKQQPLQDDPILGVANIMNNGQDEISPAPGLVDVSGPLVAPADCAHAGIWLASAFGAPATSGTTPNYTHVFTSGGLVLPERTVERKMVKNGGNILVQTVGLMVNKISLQASRAAGYARLTCDCLGYDEVNLGTVSGAGTPAAMWARDPLAAALGIYKMDGTQAAILECNVAYENNLVARDELGDARVSGFDPGVRKVTGTIRLRLRDLTLYDAAAAGMAHQGELLYQKNANRSLSWLMPVVKLETPSVPNEGPDGIDVTFNLRAEQSAGAAMLSVTLKGGQSSYATA